MTADRIFRLGTAAPVFSDLSNDMSPNAASGKRAVYREL